jgi:uncharacterized membrane protein
MKANQESIFKTFVALLILSIVSSIFTNGYSLIATPFMIIAVLVYLNRIK